MLTVENEAELNLRPRLRRAGATEGYRLKSVSLAVKIAQFAVLIPCIMVSNHWEAVSMANKRERPQSHEDGEARKLLKRVEEKQASQEAAIKGDTKRTLDN